MYIPITATANHQLKTHISSDGAKSIKVIVDIGQGTLISAGHTLEEKISHKDDLLGSG